MIDDLDEYYAIVGRELSQGRYDEGLMARALSEGNGDTAKAQSRYVKHRVAQLVSQAEVEAKARQSESEAREEEARSRIRQDLKREQIASLGGRVSKLLERRSFLVFLFESANPHAVGISDAEQVECFLSWDDSSAIYSAAYRSHYSEYSPEEARPTYEYLVLRFPGSVECGYAESQLKNIAKLTDAQKAMFAKKRAKL